MRNSDWLIILAETGVISVINIRWGSLGPDYSIHFLPGRPRPHFIFLHMDSALFSSGPTEFDYQCIVF